MMQAVFSSSRLLNVDCTTQQLGEGKRKRRGERERKGRSNDRKRRENKTFQKKFNPFNKRFYK
jgi:hypothetical protein